MLVSELGEEALLERMRDLFAVPADEVAVGIGDDAAVLAPTGNSGEQQVWTTDMLLEDIHFRRGWQTAADLGRKCLAVNLSDLASMGASPRFALLSLACPPALEVDYIIEFCQGMKDLADEAGAVVIGGDTSASGDGLLVSIAAGGDVPAGKACLRSGAMVGDALYVTGHLGCAAGGLKILEGGGRMSGEEEQALINAFVRPEARIKAGIAARENGATAMTDISDGLASDLRHVCTASGVGAVVHRDDIMIHPELAEAASENDWDLDRIVLSGGEDYELLFTLPAETGAEAISAIEDAARVPVTRIGEIVHASEGLSLRHAGGKTGALPAHGYDHFLGDG